MKNIEHEYSCILMKTEVMSGKLQKNQGGSLPKLYISQLLIALCANSDFILMLRHSMLTKMIQFIAH